MDACQQKPLPILRIFSHNISGIYQHAISAQKEYCAACLSTQCMLLPYLGIYIQCNYSDFKAALP